MNSPSVDPKEALERLRATLDRAYGVMAQAHDRIHQLSRSSDTELAERLQAARAQIEQCKKTDLRTLIAEREGLAAQDGWAEACRLIKMLAAEQNRANAAETKLAALEEALDRIARLKNSVGLGPARAIAERVLYVVPSSQGTETIPDSDAVCATCRWRFAHAPDCPLKDEPWPTVTVSKAQPHRDVSGLEETINKEIERHILKRARDILATHSLWPKE